MMEGTVSVDVPYLPQCGSYLDVTCDTAELSVPCYAEVSKAAAAPICDCIHTLHLECRPDAWRANAMSEVLNLPLIKRLQHLHTLVLIRYNSACPLEHAFLRLWLAGHFGTVQQVHFQECAPHTRAFMNALQSDGLVPEVFWSDHM
jgi:hypothetical protein